MRKKISNILKFLIFLVAGILLLWVAFRNINFISLKEGPNTQNIPGWPSSLFSVLAYISRARRWILLINPLGYKPSFANTFNSLMSGYLANLALPRIGEVSRCILLGKKEKIPVDQLFGTVIIERTIDFFSLLALMILVVIISGNTIVYFLREHILIPLQEKLTSVFGSAILLDLNAFLISSCFIPYFQVQGESEKITVFRKIVFLYHRCC